jgi:hypothetical protein
MADTPAADDRHGRTYSAAIDLVRELNTLQEAACGVAPEYQWHGWPAGARRDGVGPDDVPPSWLTKSADVAPASEGELRRLLRAFAERWAPAGGAEELALLQAAALRVRWTGHLVRFGQRPTKSTVGALASAAVEIARTVRLISDDTDMVAALRPLVETELAHFDVIAAYAAVDGELSALDGSAGPATRQAPDLAAVVSDGPVPPNRFYKRGREIPELRLSPLEYRLLEELRGKDAISFEDAQDLVWEKQEVEDSTIRSFVSRLKRKLHTFRAGWDLGTNNSHITRHDCPGQ